MAFEKSWMEDGKLAMGNQFTFLAHTDQVRIQ